ncbi:2Fe-2S iron-sulfur cluster-binding protein [Candidatus Rariloculus sp.]|uniref:2Fe-2S iron-sulfur cluster-binding protein n=1 Tax=Candidatus Rariloculus sp. TaxID=3101265 RepID=UPI003D0D621C
MVKLVVTNRVGATVEVDAQPGISMMENIRELDDSVDAICGGMCSCATCHVYIEPSWADRLPERGYEELMMLEDLESFDPARSRLSCQIEVTHLQDGIALTVGPEE